MELVGIKSEKDYTGQPGEWFLTLNVIVRTEHQTDALVAVADIVGQALEDAR